MAAKTPDEIDALDTYTDAQMLALVRWAVATVLSSPAGASVSVAGRSYTMADLAQLREMETHYAGKVNVASRPRILLADVSGADG